MRTNDSEGQLYGLHALIKVLTLLIMINTGKWDKETCHASR